MTPKQIPHLAQLRTAHAEMTDADFLAWGTTPTYTESATPALVTYQKLRALLTKDKVDAIHAVVGTQDPIGDQLLFTTGVDVNFADAKALLAALPTVTQGFITEADCDAIRDLGRTKTTPFDMLGEVTQADLDLVPRFAAIDALSLANEARYAAVLELYNAGQRNCDRMRDDVTIGVPADLDGLDEMEKTGQ